MTVARGKGGPAQFLALVESVCSDVGGLCQGECPCQAAVFESGVTYVGNVAQVDVRQRRAILERRKAYGLCLCGQDDARESRAARETLFGNPCDTVGYRAVSKLDSGPAGSTRQVKGRNRCVVGKGVGPLLVAYTAKRYRAGEFKFGNVGFQSGIDGFGHLFGGHASHIDVPGCFGLYFFNQDPAGCLVFVDGGRYDGFARRNAFDETEGVDRSNVGLVAGPCQLGVFGKRGRYRGRQLGGVAYP